MAHLNPQIRVAGALCTESSAKTPHSTPVFRRKKCASGARFRIVFERPAVVARSFGASDIRGNEFCKWFSRACFKNGGTEGKEAIPQRLKPLGLRTSHGTAEAAPFQNRLLKHALIISR
jgi:hypothetical protein